MAVEMIPWPISMKECCRTRGSNPRPSAVHFHFKGRHLNMRRDFSYNLLRITKEMPWLSVCGHFGSTNFHKYTVVHFYTPPHKLRTLSVRPSVCLSALRFRALTLVHFDLLFFKLCIDIGIGEEWYGVANGLISFWNNRVMALDVCQKFFALRSRALTLVHFYRFSSNFA